jgi:hypothetical protein
MVYADRNQMLSTGYPRSVGTVSATERMKEPSSPRAGPSIPSGNVKPLMGPNSGGSADPSNRTRPAELRGHHHDYPMYPAF